MVPPKFQLAALRHSKHTICHLCVNNASHIHVYFTVHALSYVEKLIGMLSMFTPYHRFGRLGCRRGRAEWGTGTTSKETVH